ncbi:MFS transporter [Nocardia pseudobrasiliensis]|uniref:MFS transporter n=1 Tax=Nocardia pseudobrasiliensis TaxID=45979 RepID=A0A370I9L8_9NOCA|nr:MFS transporter [Nocardia pseudobrasiliensis]RDI67419.1 MFS transporter [Nocardia pseudobrasiliensis]
MSSVPASDARWGDLLTRERLGVTIVLAGGTALYAISSYVTASLLPTAIDEIGGAQYLAWATTVFVVASIVSSTLVGTLLSTRGPVGSYLTGFLLFSIGTVVCAASPSMALLLVGRVIQGLGGGLLMGLGYAVIHQTYPPGLRARAAALVSAMWGVGTFVGPALGGAFAQLGPWRLAFVFLAVITVSIGAIVPFALRGTERSGHAQRVPVVSLTLLMAAAATVSVSGVLPRGGWTLTGIGAALLIVAAFLIWERRATVTVLPRLTFARHSPLRWIYLTMTALAIGISLENFVPLFAQELGGLAPLAAGFVGAAASLGWTLAQVSSASATRPTVVARLRVAGPAVLTLGLTLTALTQIREAGLTDLLVWVVWMMVAGSGIGLAWPHLSAAVMASSPDPAEAQQAAAAIGTVQLIATAFGAAIAGVLVNLGEPSMLRSARFLEFGLAVIAALGVVAALAAQRAAARTETSRGRAPAPSLG